MWFDEIFIEGLNFCHTGWLSYESTFVRKIEVLGLKLKQADEEKPEEFSRGKNDSIEDFLHQKISYMTNSTLKLKQVNEEEKPEIEFLKGGKSDSKEDPVQLKVSYKTNSIQSSINNATSKELNLSNHTVSSSYYFSFNNFFQNISI